MGSRKGKIGKQSKPQASHQGFVKWWFILPALVGCLLYLNTLGHFWCLDDYSVIVDNWVTKMGWKGIPIHLTEHYRYGYWGGSGDLYRPLSLIMFAGEWALFGNNPFPGHVVNVMLYAAICFLVGFVLFKWSNRPLFSLIAAFLFAVHPIHTEVVANIKSRDELLAMLFLLFTWGIWQRVQHSSLKMLYLVLAMITFSLAMLAKESAITFLPILPLSVYFFQQNPKRADLILTSIMLIPAGIFLLIRKSVLGDIKGLDKISILDNVMAGASDTIQLLATSLRHLGEYLRILIMPWPLVSDKGWNQIPLQGFNSIGVWLSILVVLIGFWAIYFFWSKRKMLVFGLLWFILTFSLTSNLLFLIGTSYGERLLFVPSVGFAIMLAALFTWREGKEFTSLSPFIRQPLGIAFLSIIGVFSILTMLRNPAWKDSFTLYSTDIIHSPQSVKLRYHYALEKGKQAADLPEGPQRSGLLTQAIEDLEIVVDKHPSYWEAHSTHGLYAYRTGDRDGAMASYEKATALNPNAAITWSNMGIIYAEKGQLDKALEVYQKAVDADPRFVDALTNLGAIRAQLGQFNEAISAFQEALKYDPENVRILNMLGSAYRDNGRPDLGQPFLDKARRGGVQ